MQDLLKKVYFIKTEREKGSFLFFRLPSSPYFSQAKVSYTVNIDLVKVSHSFKRSCHYKPQIAMNTFSWRIFNERLEVTIYNWPKGFCRSLHFTKNEEVLNGKNHFLCSAISSCSSTKEYKQYQTNTNIYFEKMLLKDFNKFNNNQNIKGSILHLNISFHRFYCKFFSILNRKKKDFRCCQ